MKIDKKHLTTIYNICRRISSTTGVDAESLYSECTSKIPTIIKNFREELGKPFEAYLAISVRGYALNYCRDKSFLSTVSRSDLYLYMQSKKFDTLEQASNQLLVPLHILEDIHLKVRNSRKYNSISIEEEWKLGTPTVEPDYSSARFLLTELISEKEELLLTDVFVKKLSNSKLKEKYGGEYKTKVLELKGRLEEEKEQFMEWLS